MSDEVTPFRIDIPEADLDDLHQRLRGTRWPEPETVNDWPQGILAQANARYLDRYLHQFRGPESRPEPT
jgi:epoxide hydrolase